MPTSRKVQASSLLLCLLLGVAGTSTAGAREVRLHGPNGNGGCADASTGTATKPATTVKPATTPAAIIPGAKIKPVVGVRGGGDDGVSHAPRWHSFLPGMFR